MNARQTLVLGSGSREVPTPSAGLRVGDVVKVMQDQVGCRVVLGSGRREAPTPWAGLLVGDVVVVTQDQVGC